MKLEWLYGDGPADTQQLAGVVEAEGRLGKYAFYSELGERCLWGVVGDWQSDGHPHRLLALHCERALNGAWCSLRDNDAFRGTDEERCQEMARRMRAIP